jgi:succinate dehydrogenase / fumarate reductase cytochrome b subunit
MARQKPAPKFLNLLLIKLPPGGIASIGHRISGVLLFLCIPLLAWLFGLSLESAAGFQQARQTLHSTPVILLSVLLVWSLSHHLLAGIRHLLLDVEIGLDKAAARASAWLVNLGAVLATAWYAVTLL